MNQVVLEGPGSFNRISEILSKLSGSKIFVVAGKNSFEKSGTAKKLEHLISKYNFFVFSEFSSNPKIEDLNIGLRIYLNYNPDLVIAIGGGSSIDIAKMINFFGNNKFSPIEFVTKKPSSVKPPKPFIAVPTTAGTGSEATHFAVLYVNKTKYSIAHPSLLPNYAIIDPELMLSMPKRVIASSGMDAFSQAIESYWNINSTEESKKYATEAIKIVLNNLATAVHTSSLNYISKMAKAAFLSGKAINITRTTAPHAVSYPLTTYFRIPHGHAVSLTLSSFLKYNYFVNDSDILDKRGVSYVKKTINELIHFLNSDNLESAQQTIENLMDEIGLERRLSKLGIKTENDIELIVKNGFNPERIVNNPRKLTSNNLKELLKSLL